MGRGKGSQSSWRVSLANARIRPTKRARRIGESQENASLSWRLRCSLASPFRYTFQTKLGSLSNDNGDVNENGKKRNRFRSAKQQLCTCITLFCTFLSRFCTTITLKCLISRFVEDENTRQLSFSFPEL